MYYQKATDLNDDIPVMVHSSVLQECRNRNTYDNWTLILYNRHMHHIPVIIYNNMRHTIHHSDLFSSLEIFDCLDH